MLFISLVAEEKLFFTVYAELGQVAVAAEHGGRWIDKQTSTALIATTPVWSSLRLAPINFFIYLLVRQPTVN